jgi:SAM-dependent methyltransferase
MDHLFDAAFWDDRYRQRQAAWDDEPNPFLPEDIAGLQPGTALDVGCGEGSDAVWLAKRGWNVTAVDISQVALDRGRAADTDHLVTWQQADVLAWTPPADAFDLVTMHFFHIPLDERTALFGRLAQAVRSGGTLLVVAHHISDLETTIGRPPLPELFYSADEVEAALTSGRWGILVSGTRPRPATDPQMQAITIHDTLFKARRIE